MLRRTVILIVGICCIVAITGHAQRTQPVVLYAVGGSSCGTWLDAREKSKTNRNDVRFLQFESFMLGFASAYNWYANDAPAQGVLAATDMNGELGYLDKFCRDNPTYAFAAAVDDMLRYLNPQQR